MPSAVEDVEALDPHVYERIRKRIRWLAENLESLKPEPLEGNWKNKLKFRVGDYRIIYTVNRVENHLMIHMVRHRREIYRRR